MTKKQEQMLDNYRRSNATELWEVYGRCSEKKREAFEKCRKLQATYGGWGGRICTANSYRFTYAFKFDNGYNQTCLCYITNIKDGTIYEFPIPFNR